MSLSPGSRLGPYEVVAAIGAGGMGEVYRARDTKLGRDVALKILPDAFAGDPDRLSRFQREAQVLAALNHPHIAIIHGLEETDGTRALVMEFIPGVTLAARISNAGGPLDLEQALPIARQIALALEAAHERGIVHRDLKPANIKVRDDGVVKVLDFGLAKEIATMPAGDLANSPTITTPVQTARGELFGTAAYMSPEQARGKPVDKRADIWAFGVVVHEMLTGHRLFKGESATDVIAQVLTREPDWNALPNDLPPAIRTLLRRCLTRDPNNRLRDIGEARIAIDEYLAHPAQADGTAAAVARPSRWARVWPIAVATAGGVAAGVAIGLALRPPPISGPAAVTTRASITLPSTQTLSNPGSTTFALSPDGRRLIYKANVEGTNRLFLRDMHLGGEGRAIPDTDATESFTFSPDGNSLAFSARKAVRKVPLSGGTPIQLCTCTVQTGMFWAPDGFVYFAGYGDGKWSLRRMPATGGGPALVPMPADLGARQLTHPAPLPGGKRLLVVVSDPGGGAVVSPGIAAYDLETTTLTPLVDRGTSPWYLPTGHLLFARNSVLYAVAFDAATLTISGQPSPLIEHVTMSGRYNVADYAVANDTGTAVYSQASFARARVVKFQSETAPESVLDRQGFLDLDLSSDGRHLAVTVDPRGIPNLTGHPYKADLYTRELALGDFTQRATGEVRAPVFLPGSTRVAVGAGSAREWAIDLVGSTREAVFAMEDQPYPLQPASFSPDGKRLAYDHNGNLYVLPLEGERTPEEFLQSRYSQSHPVFSPDGKWIAYELSDGRGGPGDIHVRPYPAREPAIRVSTEGGVRPRWSPDGKRIHFLDPAGRIMAADVVPGKAFQTSAPRVFVPRMDGIRAFALAADGRTFYAIVSEVPGPPPKRDITVVTTWFEEIRRVVGEGPQQR